MAKLTKQAVMRLAALARLELTDLEADQFGREISSILSYVEQLQQADVAGVEPLYQVTGLTNVTRPDEVSGYGITTEALLKNVGHKDGTCIKTARVLE